MGERDWLPRNVRAIGAERMLRPGQARLGAGQRTIELYEIVSGRIRPSLGRSVAP